MIATVTKRWVTFGNEHYAFRVLEGTEVEVYPDVGTTKQVHYTDEDGTLHVAYNVNDIWLASVVIYRRAKDLGYG